MIRLINNIAAQFAHRPVADAAPVIAEHIRQFWDPRMRAQVLALDASEQDELDERALAAIALLRDAANSAP